MSPTSTRNPSPKVSTASAPPSKSTDGHRGLRRKGDPCRRACRRSTADRLIAERGFTLVHPYDDAIVIAGQGTAGLEFIEDCPALDCLIVPIGGGGFISGVAAAVKALKPEAEIVGVEVEMDLGLCGLARRASTLRRAGRSPKASRSKLAAHTRCR